MKRTVIALAGLLSLLTAGTGQTPEASASRTWTQRDREHFAAAQRDGVAVSGEGALRLSARVIPLFEVPQPNVWCLARDSKGRIYSGGGNDGRVYRLNPGATTPEMIFDATELAILAMAVDKDDRLYVASSPNGAIYRIESDGTSRMIFDPDAVYVWALLFDDRGRLHVATGTPGRVLRIDEPSHAGGRGVAPSTTLLESGEDHIRSLVRGDDGTFYAGSDQNGIIYRIGPKGETSVVYDSPMREIAALAVDGDRIYAAGIAPAQQRGGDTDAGSSEGVTRVRVTAEGSEEEQPQQPQQGQGQRRPPAQERYFGMVYAVSADGNAQTVWESRQDLPLSLALLGEARDGMVRDLLIGTGGSGGATGGDQGEVILLTEPADASTWVSVPSQQVNALLRDADGTILAAASNLGQVVRIAPGTLESGTVTSTVHDAGFTASWGSLSWVAEVPRGASVTMQVRTGETEQPDATWSIWSDALSEATGSPIRAPRARFIQWRSTLKAGSGGTSPVLRSVQVGYLPDNVPPRITSVEVQPPGTVLMGTPGNQGNDGSNNATSRRPTQPPRRSAEKGMRAVSWSVEDANDDEMKYRVEFKAEDETLWKPLVEDLATEFHTWDESSMPDGTYRLRISASDSPSNPPGTERTVERISPAFDIDNTPPVVGPLRFEAGPGGPGPRSGEVVAKVHDASSPIVSATYSVDAGEWTRVHPVDGVADSPEEEFRFTVKGLAAGEHTVTLRVSDQAGNTGAGKVVITVE